jgi:Protein of unknown function (DUF3592)
MNRGRLFAIVGGIFGLVGVVLLGVAIVLAVSTASFQASAERTDGTVVALTERTSTSSSGGSSTAWYPTVEYTVDGKRYSFDSPVGAYPPAYAEGDTVAVAYDPADPADAQIDSFWSAYLAPVIVGGLGIVFTPLGTVLFVAGRRTLRQRDWLLSKGREVWAEIADVGFDFNVRINGRHPYVVRATWTDEQTGRTHLATSDPLRHDPGPGLRGRAHVRVLYDPADPDRNVVDLDTVR